MCCGLSSHWLRCFCATMSSHWSLCLWVMVDRLNAREAPLFHCHVQTTILLWRFFKACKVPEQKRQICFSCKDVPSLFQSLSQIQKSLPELGCLDLLEKFWLNATLVSLKSAFSNVNLHSVSVVLHVASITNSISYLWKKIWLLMISFLITCHC